MINKLVLVLLAVLSSAFCTSTLAGWELYDDISSGAIDAQRWGLEKLLTNMQRP